MRKNGKIGVNRIGVDENINMKKEEKRQTKLAYKLKHKKDTQKSVN